jgi:hypothetical protein
MYGELFRWMLLLWKGQYDFEHGQPADVREIMSERPEEGLSVNVWGVIDGFVNCLEIELLGFID